MRDDGGWAVGRSVTSGDEMHAERMTMNRVMRRNKVGPRDDGPRPMTTGGGGRRSEESIENRDGSRDDGPRPRTTGGFVDRRKTEETADRPRNDGPQPMTTGRVRRSDIQGKNNTGSDNERLRCDNQSKGGRGPQERRVSRTKE